jgi:hypothetical protein
MPHLCIGPILSCFVCLQDGKITGSVQRTNGKVNMTIQMVAMKQTTSFNFVGLMNESGVLMGTFSGCEISKSAGTVSGTFKMHVCTHALSPLYV